MKTLLFLYCAFLLQFSNSLYGQKAGLTVPRNVMTAYASGTRSMDGMPGAGYWQNRGDYTMKISFDPQTRILSGSETIVYYNNSPDTLNKIVIHLFPDFYKKGLMRNYPVDESDENEGVTITSLSVENENLSVSDNRQVNFSGTNMTLIPKNYLLPNTKINFQISWHYVVNKGSHVRTGAVDASSFFLAYTFPRIAVYDDIDGWDEWNYIGMQEFYNDFGNFDVEITVPKGFIVWGTGTLQNAKEVFDPRIYDRYQTALTSDSIIHIIDSTVYRTEPVTANAPLLTWKFSAKEVTDFAFALSDHYLWDGGSVVVDQSTRRRVFVDAAYSRSSADFYEVADVARKTVDIMSSIYPAIPFPYPHITIFNGLDQMEYPMIVNDNSSETRKDMVQLTTHEVSHAYFPFYMGTNETKYAWMDEGWATICESLISPMLGEPEDDGIYMRSTYEAIAGTDQEVPLITNSQLITGGTYFTNAYGKTGIFLWVLQNLLGDELFLKALQEYINRWHGKHPIPYDFFNTFSNATGQNLDWLFYPWFFETGFPDLALKEVVMSKRKKIPSNTWEITISRKGEVPVPVHLEFILENDSVIKRDATAAVWKEGSDEYVVFQALPGKLKSIRLGSEFIPDVDRTDNVWKQQ